MHAEIYMLQTRCGRLNLRIGVKYIGNDKEGIGKVSSPKLLVATRRGIERIAKIVVLENKTSYMHITQIEQASVVMRAIGRKQSALFSN